MSVVETILVYAVAPLAVVVLLAALTFLPGGRRRPRYKPGQPWPHEPVWYEPHPEHAPSADPHGDAHGDAHALGTGSHRAAITAGAPVATPTAVGGPLGGARGTW